MVGVDHLPQAAKDTTAACARALATEPETHRSERDTSTTSTQARPTAMSEQDLQMLSVTTNARGMVVAKLTKSSAVSARLQPRHKLVSIMVSALSTWKLVPTWAQSQTQHSQLLPAELVAASVRNNERHHSMNLRHSSVPAAKPSGCSGQGQTSCCGAQSQHLHPAVRHIHTTACLHRMLAPNLEI